MVGCNFGLEEVGGIAQELEKSLGISMAVDDMGIG